MRTLHEAKPLFLSLAPWSACGNFTRSFDRFPDNFLKYHPGYALIRPALLPLIIPTSTAEAIWRSTQAFLQALQLVPIRRFNANVSALIEALGYSGEDRTWLQTMTESDSVNLATAFARADFVVGKDGLRLVEVNVGPTVGGIGILDRYADVFEAMAPAFLDQEMQGRIVMPRPTRLWARCLEAFASATGPIRGNRLRIALVIADEEIAVPHPYEASRYLERDGIDVEVVRAREISFNGMRAESSGRPIDVLYGCFTYDQLVVLRYRRFVERAMTCRRAGGPLYFSPPIFTVFGNKATLTYLDEFQGHNWIDQWMARSYRLKEEASLASDHQDRLVLKPTIGSGGEGVVIGRDCTQNQWIQAVDNALVGPRRYVLQEYIAPMPIEFPTSRGAISYHVGIGCLVFCGQFAGFLVRHTPTTSGGVINCKQGATFAGACIVDDSYLEAVKH